VVPGWRRLPSNARFGLAAMRDILNAADPYRSILYGALASAVVAVLISVVTRAQRLREAVDAGTEGMARMFPAVVILILAWALSAATQALQLGQVISHELATRAFSPTYLPVAVFGSACVVSFATGTSWGTMGILCPVAVEVGARLVGDLPHEQALPLFYSTVGAVLAGAVFGDHCSPISDTTVLSALASSCKLEEHVWTQIPYAMTAAAVAVLAGHGVCNVMKQPWWMGLAAGVLLLLLFVRVVGRRPPAPKWFDEHPSALMR